jgi:transposase
MIFTPTKCACDRELEQRFSALKPRHDAPVLPPLDPSDKPDSHSKNGPSYDARTLLYQAVGVDLCAITGMNELTVQQALTETGTDMSPWRTVKHFCAWLRLAPANDISGGKVLRSRTLKTHNRATQAFRLAAQAASRSVHSAYGAYYRQMRARLGPQKALTALAHKIARTYYYMLKHRTPFHKVSAEEEEQKARDRELTHLQKKAARLGMTLMPQTATA